MIGAREVDVGIAVTAGAVTAVTRRAGAVPAPVLVDGWPTQTVDVRDEDQLAVAIARVRDAVRPDVGRVVVTYPGGLGSARTHRLHRAVQEAGWTQVRMVSNPVAAGIAHSSGYNPGITAVVDATGDRIEGAVMVSQPGAVWGVVASTVTGTPTQAVVDVVEKAVTAADVAIGDVQRVVLIAAPPQAQGVVARLAESGVSDVTVVSPVELADDGLAADSEIAGGDRREGVAIRRKGAWPRPVSSLACLVASLVALGAVLSGAGSIGAQPDATTFALTCLGLVTAIMGAASFLASRLVSRLGGDAGWARAGRVLMAGAGVGAAGVVAAIVTVATVFAIPAWSLAAVGGLAVLGPVAACGVIAIGIAWHPETPPTRRLWPPVGAMTAVAVAAVFVHNSHLESTSNTGWDLLPARAGVAVWVFAIAGLLITAPWPRVIVGLVAAAAAGLFVSAGTVSLFAVLVVAVVSGWWIVTAGLAAFDRHGLPQLEHSNLPGSISSPTRTVH